MKNSPATKSDIQQLKISIHNLDERTQNSLLNLDARTQKLEDSNHRLDVRTERMAVEIVRMHERMDKLEDGLKHEMRQFNSQVLGTLDAAAGRMETLWRESAIIPRVLDEHGAMLRAHETRLGRLEAR